MRKHISDEQGSAKNLGPEKTTADYDGTPFNEGGDQTFWLMPHTMGIELAVAGPYGSEDEVLAAARRIVNDVMGDEEDDISAIAVDRNGVPSIRSLGTLVDQRGYRADEDDGNGQDDRVESLCRSLAAGDESVLAAADRNLLTAARIGLELTDRQDSEVIAMIDCELERRGTSVVFGFRD